MGALISHFKERSFRDVFIDFENARPDPSDELGVMLQGNVERSNAIVEKIIAYKGCGPAIREAMSKPSAETENVAWAQVLPCVAELREFFLFAGTLEAVPKLLAGINGEPKNTLVQQQSRTKHLADIFNFAMLFDEQKMKSPQLQNDFAFYRRVMSRHPTEQIVSDDDSYKMSMFFAHSNPMLKTLINIFNNILRSEADSNVPDILSYMSNVCYSMVENHKFNAEATNEYCLRVCVMSLIIYDNIYALGAFHKKSPIWIKKIASLLINAEGNKKEKYEFLLNSIRYSTVNLNKEETPQSIKDLLA
eukprot:comp21603_c0_seq4/m.47569 comp21603_c0_seq4/g.47569  ORF comp21603_c0_seq4/g.47569 comp21603_c0_seq4/m.47569 type:complete len:305 (-) comp21603_c0_seq4:197-1111(-)